MIRLPLLSPDHPDAFPPVSHALAEPDGLLAMGGDLSPERLLAAYRRGIFPWFSGDEPILWWSPSRRCVFDTAAPHVSRRLGRQLARLDWTIRIDTAFARVVQACAAPRARERGTWITADMHAAYLRLHRLGHAHSIEAWCGDLLVGGLYGVGIGRLFCGESMFSASTNGSKVALLATCRLLADGGCPLLDAQVVSPHLVTLGAQELDRADYCTSATRLAADPAPDGLWQRGETALRPADLAG